MKNLILFLSLIFCLAIYSDPFSKEKKRLQILSGFSKVKRLITNKESIFTMKNRRAKPNDIDWVNRRLDFIYEINIIVLDELKKVLYNKNIDTVTKDFIISLYINPLIKSQNPKSFNYLQELSMNNNEDLKYVLYTSKFAKKGWFLDKKISKKGIIGSWITLAHSRYFDCNYQENYLMSKLNKLIKKKKISDIGLMFITNVDNGTPEFKNKIRDIILEENDTIWINNLKYINITLDLYQYMSSLKERVEMQQLLEKENSTIEE